MSKDPKAVLARAQRVSRHGTSDDPTGIDGGNVYTPYELSSHPEDNLHIIRQLDTSHNFPYRYRMDVMHTMAYNDIIVIFSFVNVRIYGENLQELVENLSHNRCTAIFEFNANQWQRPEKGMPIIEKIDVQPQNDKGFSFDKKDK